MERMDGLENLIRLRDSSPLLDTPQELREAGARDGYLFFRRLVEPADVLSLRSLLLSMSREIQPAAGSAEVSWLGGYQDPRWVELQCRLYPSVPFNRLKEHPTVRRVLESLLEGPVRSDRGDTCRIFAPAMPGMTTLPHQDRFYVPGEGDLWTVWIPLGDCPLELGGLAVLAGSHREGLRSHDGPTPGSRSVEVAADAAWSAEDYRCGDALMFHGLTVHRALENRTDRFRLSADFRYEGGCAS